MKRVLILSAILVLVLSFAAFGDTADFGKFTAEVPAGWTASMEGPTAIFIKDDKTASLSITLADTEGTSLADLAAAFVQELNGQNLEQDSDGDYTFDIPNAKALLTGNDDQYCLFVMAGLDTAGDEITAIMGSIQDK